MRCPSWLYARENPIHDHVLLQSIGKINIRIFDKFFYILRLLIKPYLCLSLLSTCQCIKKPYLEMPKNKRNKSVKILLLQRLTISMILNSQIKYANKYSCKHDQWMLGFRNQVVDSFTFFLLWNCIFLFSTLSFFIPILRITTQRHQNIFIINIHNIQADCRLSSHGTTLLF